MSKTFLWKLRRKTEKIESKRNPECCTCVTNQTTWTKLLLELFRSFSQVARHGAGKSTDKLQGYLFIWGVLASSMTGREICQVIFATHGVYTGLRAAAVKIAWGRHSSIHKRPENAQWVNKVNIVFWSSFHLIFLGLWCRLLLPGHWKLINYINTIPSRLVNICKQQILSICIAQRADRRALESHLPL